MKRTAIKRPVVGATGKKRRIVGASNGECPHKRHKQSARDQQSISIDNYLRDVRLSINVYLNSDGEMADDERYMRNWPSLPVMGKLRRRVIDDIYR